MVEPSTAINCLPVWHPYLTLVIQGGKKTIGSGCAVNAAGNVGCSPESMRASAEKQLRDAGWWNVSRKLPLETYTLARYIQSEGGSGTPEERVAIAEAALNRVRLEKLANINTLLIYRQKPGHPNYGFYGPIHGKTEGSADVTKAPYGRWAATTLDPSIANVIIADFVATGQSNNFNRGGDDQAGYGYAKAFPNPATSMRIMADRGSYWVGPLPNVNHWKTTQFRRLGIKPSSPEGQYLLNRAIQAFSDPNRAAPDWSTLTAICAPPKTAISTAADLSTPVRTGLALLAVAGLGAGYVLGRRRVTAV